MPPKGKSAGGGGNPHQQQQHQPPPNPDAIEQEPLQAVVLADSFNKRFQVLCVDKPRCLLPLLGIPLLAWTLESLSLSSVKDVIVFCGVHADAIKEWVGSSRYATSLNIQCITSQSAISPGDALRQLDAMQILNPKVPFLLLHSPVVSNYDLSNLVRHHKRLREADKSIIMTLGVGVGGRRHPESPIMVVNPQTGTLVHYTQHAMCPPRTKFTFPSALILDSKTPGSLDLEIWSGPSSRGGGGGHRDLGVDVCEADVPALFTENFDWQDVRRHFVQGVLQSELLGKKIGVCRVGGRNGLESDARPGDPGAGEDADQGAGGPVRKGVYVERVRDTRTFGDVSRDVLRRWAFPLVPDSGIMGGVDYELRHSGTYIARNSVVLARTAIVTGPSLIGPGSDLSQKTLVQRSTLGSNSSIGPHSSVRDSYVFDDVQIGRRCSLVGCIVANEVVIGDDVVVGRGALIGRGVVLGKGAVVKPFERIGRTPYKESDGFSSDEDEDEDFDVEAHKAALVGGQGSIGYIWPQEDEAADSEDEDDVEDPYEHPDNRRLLQLGRSLSNVSLASSSASTLSHASTSDAGSDYSAASSGMQSLPSLSLGVPSDSNFHVEARLSLERAWAEGHRVEDALLELKTLMLSSNVGVSGPRGGRHEVVTFLMEMTDIDGGAKKVKQQAEEVWERWGGMLIGMGGDGVDTVLEVQRFCISDPSHSPYFPYFLSAMYNADVVDSDEVFGWYKLDVARGAAIDEGVEKEKRDGEERLGGMRELWEKGGAFVRALAEAEEEDDDEDEDEEEDED